MADEDFGLWVEFKSRDDAVVYVYFGSEAVNGMGVSQLKRLQQGQTLS
jgi:hypothetical protein